MDRSLLTAWVPTELKRLAGEAADAEQIPLAEYVARTLAAKLERPELGEIVRRPPGRKRIKAKTASRT